jgi:hypothetical protein
MSVSTLRMARNGLVKIEKSSVNFFRLVHFETYQRGSLTAIR